MGWVSVGVRPRHCGDAGENPAIGANDDPFQGGEEKVEQLVVERRGPDDRSTHLVLACLGGLCTSERDAAFGVWPNWLWRFVLPATLVMRVPLVFSRCGR